MDLLVWTPKTENQKIEIWNRIIDTRQVFYKEQYEKNSKYKEAFGKLFRLEFEGGECWMCHKPWIRHKFDNQFLAGVYYTPNCDCFIRCPECQTWLYDLQYKYSEKLLYCDNCGFMLLNKVTKTKRYGGEYEIYYNGLSRKEQISAWMDKGVKT